MYTEGRSCGTGHWSSSILHTGLRTLARHCARSAVPTLSAPPPVGGARPRRAPPPHRGSPQSGAHQKQRASPPSGVGASKRPGAGVARGGDWRLRGTGRPAAPLAPYTPYTLLARRVGGVAGRVSARGRPAAVDGSRCPLPTAAPTVPPRRPSGAACAPPCRAAGAATQGARPRRVGPARPRAHPAPSREAAHTHGRAQPARAGDPAGLRLSGPRGRLPAGPPARGGTARSAGCRPSRPRRPSPRRHARPPRLPRPCLDQCIP